MYYLNGCQFYLPLKFKKIPVLGIILTEMNTLFYNDYKEFEQGVAFFAKKNDIKS